MTNSTPEDASSAEHTDPKTPAHAHAPARGTTGIDPIDDGVRECPRCRDLIPGGVDEWERHAAGLDSADALGREGYAAALAEHRQQGPGISAITRASRARF